MYPILLEVGPVTLYSYGLMIAVGFLIAVRSASRRAQVIGMPTDHIQTLCVVALLCGLVGARLAYVALHWSFYAASPMEILRIDHGGLVFYGGLAGGILSTFLYMRFEKMPVLPTLDLLIPRVVMAHAIGRIGCFLNGCCYGIETTLPWGVVFPPESVTRHPTQLYEVGALLIFFGILRRLESQAWPRGTVLASYGALYGLWRFGLEFLRGDNPVVAGGLTAFQWASLPLFLICASWLFARGLQSR